MVAVLAAPATAAVASPPAVDQYTQHLPTAGGGSGPASGVPPVAQPGLLSRKTLAALTGPDGRLLAQIATASNLGAPAGTGADIRLSDYDRNFASVVADTFGTGPSLALIGAVIGIAAAGARRFSRRRQGSNRI